MSNLYARLVKKEDDRTEALVDLLERILKKDQEAETTRFRRFISEVLLDEPTAEKGKKKFLNTLKNISLNALSIKTQYQTSTGARPDIVVFNGNRPICAIEVKINAPIGEEQLESYDTFLQESADRNLAALVLLTQSTQSPEGFTDLAHDAYHTSLRSVSSWNRVAKWFEGLSQESDVDEPLKTLACEFGEFLKEENAVPTLDDIGKARLYLARSHWVLREAVKNMVDGYPLPDGWSAGDDRRIMFGRIGISGWLSPTNDQRHWIRYGICFKPVDENDVYLYGCQRYENDTGVPRPVQIEDGSYAFVCVIGAPKECEKIPGYSNNQWYEHDLAPAENGPDIDSTGWYHYRSASRGGYVKICPIQELLDSDGHIRDRLQKWTCQRLGEAVQLWEALFGRNG